jgi:CHAD domain-containing protein
MLEKESGASVEGDREVEWQFKVGELGPVEEWASGKASEPGEVKRLFDYYYDTEHWNLYRVGYALRIRRRGKNSEATLKSLDLPEDNLHRRSEVSEELDGGGVEELENSSGAVGEMVRRISGGREPGLLFEIRTRRQSFPFQIGETAAELALDDSGIYPAGGEEPVGLRRVELEIDGEPDGEVEELLQEMSGELGLRPVSLSKYEEGLSASGLVPGTEPDFGPARIDPSHTVGEVAFAVLRRQFAKMISHEAGTRMGEDAEELHDMRVASRRLRSAVKLFSGFLPQELVEWEEELKWVARALGEVRDLDVQLEEIEGFVGDSEEEREALDELSGVLRQRRGAARGRMLQVLNSERYREFEGRFAALLGQGPSGEEAGRPVLEVAPGLLHERYRKVQRAAKRIGEDSTAEEYHDLRKKAKRFRYALEFFGEAYGDCAKPIKRLKQLQDALGRHQDAVVAAQQLRRLSTEGELSHSAAFQMGAFAERYNREAAEIREKIPGSKSFRKASSGKLWKSLRKSL